jgi:hypothetical protein
MASAPQFQVCIKDIKYCADIVEAKAMVLSEEFVDWVSDEMDVMPPAP